MERLDFSKITRIDPKLNITEFPDLGDGRAENPSISDGEHIILECKNCRAPLADVWVTSPEIVMTSKIQAKCDHCGNKSFIKEVKGKFHLGATEYSAVTDAEITEATSEQGVLLTQTIQLTTTKIKDHD